MPESIKALFLDFDGTLADSIGVMRDIYYRYLAEFGKQGSEEEFHSLNGPPLPKIVEILKRTHNLSEPESELLARYEIIIDADYGKAGMMPGADRLIGMACAARMKIGIVTSGKEVWVRAWLKRNDLEDFVHFIIDRNSTPRGKPAPDPYLEALKRAGCNASEACAAEDSATGVTSALAAGIKTFAIGVDVPGSARVENLQGIIDALHAA